MPTAPLTFCATPGCGARVRAGHCDAHRRHRDQARASSHARGYDHRWRLYSRAWLQRYPLCGMRQGGHRHGEHSACARAGRIVAATCTDHIVPHRGDRALFWSAQNHQSLCPSCHSSKTAGEDGGFGRPLSSSLC